MKWLIFDSPKGGGSCFYTFKRNEKKKLKHEGDPLQFLLSDEQSAFFVKENDFSALAFNYFNLFIYLLNTVTTKKNSFSTLS